jgi:PAS domain-containing protein
MDSKSPQFCALDAPTQGPPENGFAPAHGQDVWRDAECANSAEGRGKVSRAIGTKAVPLGGDLGQSPTASATPEVVYDTPSDALWINEQGQILDCSGLIEEMFGYWKDELKGQHISMLLPDLTHSSFMQYSSPSTLWLDDQGQILDCSGPVEEMFGYWKSELKGRHVSMLLPDLAHTEWLEHNGDNSPRLAVQSCGAIAFGGVKPAGDDGAYSEFLKLISTKAGRELTVILRSQIH